MANITHVDDQTFEAAVLRAAGPVVVDFYADWCGPCKRMAPILEAVAETSGSKICKLNIDDSPATAAAYGVSSIPTLILFRDGKAEKSIVGLQPKNVVENWIGL